MVVTTKAAGGTILGVPVLEIELVSVTIIFPHREI
jgi:hypothetical protein